MKYVGECKINLWDPSYLQNIHQSNLEGSTTPKKLIFKSLSVFFPKLEKDKLKFFGFITKTDLIKKKDRSLLRNGLN